mmetsp:Transcript_6909/g.20251  ORF Transcript_6909/g.20251 Transcript_6909/m.20251 type:complete len:502 (+) Transcript_6909:277-1782(+)
MATSAAPEALAAFPNSAALDAALAKSAAGAAALFAGDDPYAPSPPVSSAIKAKIASKVEACSHVKSAPGAAPTGRATREERKAYVDGLAAALSGARPRKRAKAAAAAAAAEPAAEKPSHVVSYDATSGALVTTGGANPTAAATGAKAGGGKLVVPTRRPPPPVPQPTWHAPWKLAAVASGHLGWVRCVAFEPRNEWFVTGGVDRTIKVWDLAKCGAGAEGGLKLTLTGHINAIRGLAVSPRTTYMFSAGEDKKVLCWDLETNKVVRHYHGHLSGVYCLGLHPTLDLLMTGGRDSCVRCWDIRTSKQVMMLGGHTSTIGAVECCATDPQVVTGSHDCTIRLWDLAAGKTRATLTHHKKAIRALCCAPFEDSFVSAAADNLKKWQRKDGSFLRNLQGHRAVLNACAVNADGVLASAGDDGSLRLWDYRTGYGFQDLRTVAQPGSLECEAGIYDCKFDKSGTRLITCEADKTIKIWKEDDGADPESHPVDMKSWTKECRRLTRY